MVALNARQATTVSGFLGLGAKRIACGYLGVLGALLIYSLLDAVLSGFDKIERGYVVAEQMPALVPGWSIYLFVLLAPFAVFAVTVGLLLLRLFVSLRLVSLMGTLGIALIYAIAWGYIAYADPINAWCMAHRGECASKTFLESLLLGATVAVGFALAAGLPVGRSPSIKP